MKVFINAFIHDWVLSFLDSIKEEEKGWTEEKSVKIFWIEIDIEHHCALDLLCC